MAADPVVEKPAASVHFKNKLNYLVEGGVNFVATSRRSVGLNLRYAPFNAVDESDASGESVKLNPLTIALGLHFRV